ncbi:MAG: lecithin retinol acyltransferase family protein [Nocardioides sp.]
MSRGDHVYAQRRRRYTRYTHHGIDCGDGTVIHYAGERRTGRKVERTSWQSFGHGSDVRVRRHRRGLPPDEVVAKAESRLGADDYHLVWNNCEHFATWCSTGSKASKQVRGWAMAAPGALASFSAADALGVHLVVLGSLFMGSFYAVTKPVRRLRRRHHRRRRSALADRNRLPGADAAA